MSKDLKVLTAIRNNLLCIIDRYAATPMNSSTYKYIQDEAQKLKDDIGKLKIQIAKDALSEVMELLIGVPMDYIVIRINEARMVLDVAIETIKKSCHANKSI